MQQMKKLHRIINWVAFLGTAALIFLIFFLELAQFNLYMDSLPEGENNGDGWAALGIVVIAIYAAFYLGICCILHLIAAIGVSRKVLKKGSLIMGMVAKLLTVVGIILLNLLLLELPLHYTKILYIALAIALIVCVVIEGKSIKKLNTVQM